MDPYPESSEQQAVSAMGWEFLLPELILRVTGFLSRNEVACSLRPLCRSWASALSGAEHKTVRLSQPSPHHAFAAFWGAPSAMRGLSRKRREQLTLLTSASGSVQNLDLAVARTGCAITAETAQAAAGAGQLDVLRWLKDCSRTVLTVKVVVAAAASGHLDVCAWLVEQGYALDEYPLLAAAKAGRQDVCAWLLANGCPWTCGAVCGAAERGHVTLIDWLLLKCPTVAAGQDELQTLDLGQLLSSAAYGCPLPVLQRLHRGWAEGPGGWLERMQQQGEEEQCSCMSRVIACAAASTTPDWAAKVAWLQEDKGYPLNTVAGEFVTQNCPNDEEALTRLTWLHGRGSRANYDSLYLAAKCGKAACVRYLLAEGAALTIGKYTVATAARGGHLACLQALHAAGANMYPCESVCLAALGGHLPVVRWLVETPAGLEAAPLTVEVAAAAAAAESGSLELLRYLNQRGCPWDVATWRNALREGSEEMQEWLRERGCPTQ